jgi:hypothetical protein
MLLWLPLAIAQPSDFDGPPQMNDQQIDGPDGERPFKRWRQNRNMAQDQRPNRKQGQGGPAGRLGKIARFLEFANTYHRSIQDPYDAFGLAVMGLVEHHKKARQPDKAVGELQQLLEGTTDPRARNIVLFQLRQLFQAERQHDAVLKITHQIAQENLKVIQGRR